MTGGGSYIYILYNVDYVVYIDSRGPSYTPYLERVNFFLLNILDIINNK